MQSWPQLDTDPWHAAGIHVDIQMDAPQSLALRGLRLNPPAWENHN